MAVCLLHNNSDRGALEVRTELFCEAGLEFAWGQWKSFSTATSPELEGDQTRINATFHYNFF